jgi:hypothetical protein
LPTPATESAIAALGSLLIGIPVGIGVSIVAIRILGLFFTLQPPLVVVPAGTLALPAGSLAAASLAAASAPWALNDQHGAALASRTRQNGRAYPILGEPAKSLSCRGPRTNPHVTAVQPNLRAAHPRCRATAPLH